MQINYTSQVNLNKLGENLYYFRKNSGLSKKEVASYLNICPSQYNSFENGDMYINIPMLDILSQIYMVPVTDILYNKQKFKKGKHISFVE